MTEQERDRACIERVIAGDTGALEELYDCYADLLYSLALRITGRAADAEDVVQETWLQAWRKVDSYDRARGNVGAWLVTLVRSRAIDRVRSMGSRARAETVGGAAPAASPDPLAVVAGSQLQANVAEALAELAPQHRQVLELAFFAGLSQSEIAARLASPLGSVKSWTRQALQRLRDRLPEESRT